MLRKPLPSSDERHSLSLSRRYLGNVGGRRLQSRRAAGLTPRPWGEVYVDRDRGEVGPA